ncbi:MAG: ATP-dependent helicase [Capsulimonadaceae bacterium]
MDTATHDTQDAQSPSALLDGLNPPQKQAVLHESGPLLIFAGAGSGKTNALTKRIAYLIRERNVRPYNILAVTFTNKAAAEMKERIQRLIGDLVIHLWAGTFHSICARMLRERGRLIGLDRTFVIYDDEDQMTLIKQCLHELNIDDKQFAPRAVLAQISHLKEKLTEPGEKGGGHAPMEKVVARVYSRYQEKLVRANALDFDDIILKAVELLQESAEAREHYQERFHYVHCDEFQDVNDSQYRLLSLLAAKHRNICVVGDDDQSIYAFRGANVDLILNFDTDFPNAIVIKLEQNYRSTKTILDAAYHVVKRNRGRADKRLWTDNAEGTPITLIDTRDEIEEANSIVRIILDEVERGRRSYSDYAVLYRANMQSRAIEEQFVRRQIPYKIIGSMRFYERKEVKDVLAYLRICINPYDSISLRRVINVPARAIGATTVDRLADFAALCEIGLWDACRRVGEIGLASRTNASVAGFVKMIEYLGARAYSKRVTEFLDDVLVTTGYRAALEMENTVEARGRLDNVLELFTSAQDFEGRGGDDGDISLAAFLESIALVADVDWLDSSSETVTLMTLHAAKGLEFAAVFLSGMEEGIFPHIRATSRDEIDEERRLCYVGMTRAREDLYLSFARARTMFGSTHRSVMSRFLLDIPESLFVAKSQRRTVPSSPAPDLRRVEPVPTWEEMARPAVHRGAGVATSGNPFRHGQKVRSAKFGVGTVVSLDGSSVVNVAFAAPVGIKKLDISIAKLESV